LTSHNRMRNTHKTFLKIYFLSFYKNKNTHTDVTCYSRSHGIRTWIVNAIKCLKERLPTEPFFFACSPDHYWRTPVTRQEQLPCNLRATAVLHLRMKWFHLPTAPFKLCFLSQRNVSLHEKPVALFKSGLPRLHATTGKLKDTKYDYLYLVIPNLVFPSDVKKPKN
jgi:hypothetical protein